MIVTEINKVAVQCEN